MGSVDQLFEKFFQEYHQSIGPDLGPNCLQRLSVDDSSRQRVLHWCHEKMSPAYKMVFCLNILPANIRC